MIWFILSSVDGRALGSSWEEMKKTDPPVPESIRRRFKPLDSPRGTFPSSRFRTGKREAGGTCGSRPSVAKGVSAVSGRERGTGSEGSKQEGGRGGGVWSVMVTISSGFFDFGGATAMKVQSTWYAREGKRDDPGRPPALGDLRDLRHLATSGRDFRESAGGVGAGEVKDDQERLQILFDSSIVRSRGGRCGLE